MKTDWTKDQDRAIHTTGKNLLVSAAAGSGKTAVLAARCAYLVCDAPKPCDVTELLVVTFTNASAEEMRRRIAQAIHQRATETNDPRLKRQSLLINAAQISTIHSLGQNIIRRHFHELGIDPNFRLLDPDETKMLRADVMHELLEKRFEDPAATQFRQLVDRYASGQPKLIGATARALHAKLGSVIDPDDWLAARRSRLVEAAEKPLDQSEIGKTVIRILADRARSLADAASRLAATIDRYKGLSAYSKHVKEMEGSLRELHEAFGSMSWDNIGEWVSGFKVPTLPRLPGSAEKELMQKRIDQFKKRIKSFIENGSFTFTQQQLQEGVEQSIWVTDQIVALVKDFETAYASAKHDDATLDFNDLEQMALRLLKEPGVSPVAPSKIAREYQRQFQHVMVDEYQDVNQVQDTILALLGGSDNHFAVGDVKQSIYRFRQADPQRFISRYIRYKRDKPPSGEVIDLQKNFRSRGPLLEALNDVFSVLITRESAEVDYDNSQKLVPGASYAESAELFRGTPIELHLLEKEPRTITRDLRPDEREAVLVAKRVRELLGLDGSVRAVVTERDKTTRPIEAKDIVILLRAMTVKAEHFSAILRRAGIPVQADSTSGFFAATEVGDIICALRLLANRRDDVALAGYLRSPLCGWTDIEDKLAQIRLAYPTSKAACFHQAFEQYRQHKNDSLAKIVRQAELQLNHWREIGRNKPVADVLQAILRDTSYLSYISGLPDGQQRVANVMHLHLRATQFQTFQHPTIIRFLDFLQTIEDEDDLGMPAAAGVAQNAVRIMSIHKSKGLEFPVVIVPDMGKGHNLRDANDKLLFDDSIGIAARMVDADREVHYATLATMAASNEIRRKQIAEELRVLYVATTRAKEHLILVGTAGDGTDASWDDTWADHQGVIPALDIRDARSMLEWIGAASAIAEAKHPNSFARIPHSADEITAMAQDVLKFRSVDAIPSQIAALQPLKPSPTPTDATKSAIARLEYQYPYEALTLHPAVTSVTASTKSGRAAPGGATTSDTDIVKFDPILPLPRAIAGMDKPTPTEIGTITHDILQRIDLATVTDAISLDKALTKLVDQRFLHNDVLKYVDRAAILWLLGQPLGNLLRESKDVRREMSITYTQSVAGGEAADQQLVRGRLDAVIVEADGLTIIDYKTDRVTAETIDLRAQFYQGQIDAYRSHLESLTHRPVKAAYLVFLGARTIKSV